MPLLDYAAIKQAVSLHDVLRLIGYPWPLNGRGVQKAGCPLACCTSATCASIRLGQNVWFCHKCERGGNPLDLYRLWSCLHLYAATVQLCDRLGILPFYKGERTAEE